MDERQKRFKFVKKQIDGFHIHELDIKQAFERCGNPEVLKIVAQPDTHVRHRDYAAVDVFLQFLEWYKPHGHIIMGDFLDAEGVSHWPNDELRHRDFVSEVIEGRELLAETVKRTKNAKIRIYLEGNHEDWINQAMAAKLPELFIGLDKLGLVPDLKALLDLNSFGYDLFKVNHIFKLGNAHFTHGLYTGNNHGKSHIDKLKDNIYYGHMHDVKVHHDTSLRGRLEAASLGCLCRLDAKFMKGKPTNWAHGFGIFEFFKDGTYSFNLPRINNGTLVFAGKVFKYE